MMNLHIIKCLFFRFLSAKNEETEQNFCFSCVLSVSPIFFNFTINTRDSLGKLASYLPKKTLVSKKWPAMFSFYVCSSHCVHGLKLCVFLSFKNFIQMYKTCPHGSRYKVWIFCCEGINSLFFNRFFMCSDLLEKATMSKDPMLLPC